jgi:serine/threonine protein kinase/lipopolysaccharide biosynthesis regulator YciM
MQTARWERIQELFHQAVDLPPAEQREFLNGACAGDETILRDVLAMLAHDGRGASLLDRDVAQVADRIIGGGVPAALADQAFGPYRLVRPLGEGGMGVVYLARRDDLGSFAAIKILRDAWISPARRERFVSEQRILAQLNHPSIARIYDANTLPDGTPWFAMEYVEGVPLTDYYRSRPSSATDLRLFRTVCEAVQCAHRHLVIHRDLKPSNILVTPDGSVKLLDFGISKQLDALTSVTDPTVTGLRLMTPAYAAPEQIRAGVTGIHTDVYALGVILYELLAARPPFDFSGRTPAEAERVVLEVEPRRPSLAAQERVDRSVDASRDQWADLDVLCLTAMHKHPERRYGSVEALIRDVDHYVHDEPLEARPDSLRYRTGKFAKRNWQSLSASAAILIVLVTLVLFYTVRLATARNAAVAEAVRTERIQRFMLNLFGGGEEKDAGPAEDLRVLTLLDRGLAQARSLDREPLVQAELYQTLGGLYQKLGKFDQANTLLESSLATRRSLLGSDSADVVRGLVALASLRSNQAHFDQAEVFAREALATAKAKLRATDPLLATATSALGAILEQRGAYADAIGVLETAVQLQSAPNADQTELAATLFELASTHFYAGHWDLAESITQRALTIHRQRLGERHPAVAEDLINLAAIQHERGHYAEAEGFYRRALEINRLWYGTDNYHTASTLIGLGRALEFEDKFQDAEDALQQALTIQEHVFGPVHPLVASALNDLGNVAMKSGRPEQAEPYFRRIGEIYRSVYGDKHYLVGLAASNLAGVYMARQDYATAERMYREAVARFTEAQSPEHLNTGIARIKLGRSLLRQGRYAEAEREARAGYQIVAKQAAPTVSWLKNAREDLVAIYTALHEPEQAETFRLEAARIAQASDDRNLRTSR